MNYNRLTKGRLYAFSAHDEMQQSADMAYPFAQEPNFLWLTGLEEPGWAAVIDTATDKRWLLRPKGDEVKELFDGGLSDEQVRQKTGVAHVIPWSEQKRFWADRAAAHNTVYALGTDPYAHHASHTNNPSTSRIWRKLGRVFEKVEDCRTELSRLRAIKTEEEIVKIRQAVAVSVDAFEALKEALPTRTFEYEVEAQLSYDFRRTGALGHAYAPIIAGGKNACTLHYSQNAQALPQDGLVLIDAGVRVGGYAADITRTYALGTATPREKAVHRAVEHAHRAIIALVKPGLKFKDYSQRVDVIMQQALIELGLLKDVSDTKTYRTYFPHAISHGLGLDVHESLGGYDSFQPGMVFTIEPGIYIPEEGIGVRIEDDILVTHDGHENLSAALSTTL